jgi:DNA-binding MarR family transcriptional regulator
VAIAIIAALEHGSHTVSELAIVTAMRGPIIANNLRRLQQGGTVTRTKREGDGKAAYALTSAAA